MKHINDLMKRLKEILRKKNKFTIFIYYYCFNCFNCLYKNGGVCNMEIEEMLPKIDVEAKLKKMLGIDEEGDEETEDIE